MSVERVYHEEINDDVEKEILGVVAWENGEVRIYIDSLIWASYDFEGDELAQFIKMLQEARKAIGGE